MYTEDSGILGPQRGSIEQAVAFILARPHGEYGEKDIRETIVPQYFLQAIQVGIDPIIAVAQMIHETGNLTSFWSQRPQRNPAGIGVTGQKQATPPADRKNWAFNSQRQMWEAGLSFASWKDDAIPGHLGRLLAYALRVDEGSELQRALLAKAMSYRSFPQAFRGSAVTIKQLGKAHNLAGAKGGGWASPGDKYGVALAKMANGILNMPM